MQAIHQRCATDRRQAPTFFNTRMLSYSGRRTASRRQSDQYRYVDKYRKSVSLVAVGIVLLSAVDAALTLRLLSLGAIEINAIMAILIESNIRVFVGYKLALTGLAVLLLVIHSDFKLRVGITVNRVAQIIFGLYLCLMVYELYLFRLIAATSA